MLGNDPDAIYDMFGDGFQVVRTRSMQKLTVDLTQHTWTVPRVGSPGAPRTR